MESLKNVTLLAAIIAIAVYQCQSAVTRRAAQLPSVDDSAVPLTSRFSRGLADILGKVSRSSSDAEARAVAALEQGQSVATRPAKLLRDSIGSSARLYKSFAEGATNISKDVASSSMASSSTWAKGAELATVRA